MIRKTSHYLAMETRCDCPIHVRALAGELVSRTTMARQMKSCREAEGERSRFFHGILIALPASLLLWTLLIWGVVG